MRRLTIAAGIAATFICAAPALAITDGAPDGNRHPNVGGLVAPTAYYVALP